MELLRQGDLLFISVEIVPEAAKPREGGVLQEGESTGHAHRIIDLEGAQIFEYNRSWREPADVYIRVTADSAPVVHEEHHTITLPKGTFKINRAREFDPLSEAVRFMAD
jgi:hypothetical protein